MNVSRKLTKTLPRKVTAMGFKTCDAVLYAPGSPIQKHLLLVLAHYNNDTTGTCFPGMARLTAATGYSERGIRKALRSLEESGMIRVVRGKGRTSSRYFFPDRTYLNPIQTGRVRAEGHVVPLREECGSAKQEYNSVHTHTQGSIWDDGGFPPWFPNSEEDAVRACDQFPEIPHDYIKATWNQAVGRGFVDGNGNLIKRFANFVAARWPKERANWAACTTKRNGVTSTLYARPEFQL